MTTVAAPPLAITSRHDGQTGLRLLCNDGGYVVISNYGGTTCINRKCLDAGDAVCEHIALVKALTPADIEALPASWLSQVRSDA